MANAPLFKPAKELAVKNRLVMAGHTYIVMDVKVHQKTTSVKITQRDGTPAGTLSLVNNLPVYTLEKDAD